MDKIIDGQKVDRTKDMGEMLQALTPWFGEEGLYIDGMDICMSKNQTSIIGMYDYAGWEINRGEYEWNEWGTEFEPSDVFFDVWEWEHDLIIENIKRNNVKKEISAEKKINVLKLKIKK